MTYTTNTSNLCNANYYIEHSNKRYEPIKVSNTGNGHFCKQQQMMLERQKRLNFLVEMQYKVTTNYNNSSGTDYKIWGLGWVHSLKMMKMHRNMCRHLANFF